MNYIPLHVHTGYTFLKSGILLKKYVQFAKKLGYSYIGISDVNVIYGFPKFNKLCLENGINPIFGMDITINDIAISLFVKNEIGYKNISKISTILQKKKIISLEELKDFSSGLIGVISSKSKIFSNIKEKTFPHDLNKYASLFDDIFIGIEIYTKEEINDADLIRNFAQHYNYTVVAFPLVKYLNKNDSIVLKMLDAIDKQESFDFKENNADSHYFLKTKDEITKFYSPSELDNVSDLYEKIDFVFLRKRGNLLHFKEGKDSNNLLVDYLYKGLKTRNIDLEKNKDYKDRLNYEYLVIKKMGYSDYFLTVQDYVSFAKSNNIPVGPGRGSASGSLISYILGITDVDPIKYNLLFERFLNPQRNSMPDIDIDFSDTKRDLIFKYLMDKYGKERCARVVAFQTFASKQSLRDTTKVFGFPNSIADRICKTIPNNFMAGNYDLDIAYKNIPAFKKIIDETPDFREIFLKAHLIEGLPRQRGLHAAGLILDNNDLFESIPLTFEENNEQVTQYEKDYLEEQGFLKMDLLGLSNLSTIENCLKNIKENRNIQINLSSINLNDSSIYSLINSKRTMGLFQLDTGAATNALNYIKPQTFMDVVATISLDRPGPMEQIPLFSRRKDNKEKIVYPDDSLSPILKETYGIIVYQEQIMQICRSFAGFSFAEADLFRRAISKKHESELMKLKDKFVLGAQKNGHNIKTINTIFNLILKFASYGFNKSHAVGYAMIACQEAYLKANFGPEFYVAILDQQYGSNDSKFNKYLAEIKKSNIDIMLPDINKSGTSFQLYDDKLLMPLAGIYGLPNKVVTNIIEERSAHGYFKDFLDFVIRMYQGADKITDTQLHKLIDSGVFDNLYNNRKSLKLSVDSALTYASASIYKEGSLFNDFGLRFEYEEAYDSPEERIENELKSLGVMISDSPLRHVQLQEEIKNEIISINDLKIGVTSLILVIVRSIKTITIKNGKDKGKPMAFLTAFDESGEIDITLFSKEYASLANNLKENSIFLINGSLQERAGRLSFACNNIELMR